MEISLKQYLVLLFIFFITACQPQNPQNNQNSELEDSHASDQQEMMKEVYVTAIEVDSNIGNAAASRGILNLKNNCLFIDDMLIVIQTPYLTWKQNPFVMYNEFSKDEMRVGDMVEVGGSSTEGSSLDSEDIKWRSSPKAACEYQRVWLANNMNSL